jgi:hypothetical protein
VSDAGGTLDFWLHAKYYWAAGAALVFELRGAAMEGEIRFF